jgi:cell division protein FtsB
MEPARTAAAPRRAARTPTSRGRPKTARFAAASRVRWDRIARCTLLIVLVGVVLLYVGPARSYFSTYHQAKAARSQVGSLERQNHLLRTEQKELRSPDAIARAARRLGMVKAGERPFVVRGLPSAHGG